MSGEGTERRQSLDGGWEERGARKRSQVSVESVGRVMAGRRSRLSSLPQVHFPAFSLAPPATSVHLGEEVGLQRAPGLPGLF